MGYRLMFASPRRSPSVVSYAASMSCGTLLDMHVLRFHMRPTEAETQAVGPQIRVLISNPDDPGALFCVQTTGLPNSYC